MALIRSYPLASLLAAGLVACGGGGAPAGPQVGDCTDAGEVGLVNISEDVDVVPCEGTDAASRITKVGDDARGPSACKTTLAHIGETPVCIEELD